MIDTKTILGIAGTAGTAFVSLVSILFREYKLKVKAHETHMGKLDDAVHEVENRALVIETKMASAEPSLADVKAQQIADGLRLARTEAAVDQIKGDVGEIKAAISTKLDKIPELTEALTNFKELCKTFIPRAETEAHFEAVKERLEKLEK